MTAGATQFVTPLTLQTLSRHPVTTNIFDEKMSWHPVRSERDRRYRQARLPRMPAHLFVEDVGGDGMTRQCLQSKRSNKLGRAGRHHDVHGTLQLRQFAGYISSFVLIWVVRVGSAWENFSKVKRALLEGV